MSEVKVNLSKVKPKKAKETVTKLDLSKKKEDAVQEPSTDEIPVLNQPETSGEVEKGTPESRPESTSEAVSYKHLTLPTKRIV